MYVERGNMDLTRGEKSAELALAPNAEIAVDDKSKYITDRRVDL
jgi:hypothetical protein